MTNPRERYRIVAVCTQCETELWLTGDSISWQLGNPVKSKLEVEGKPEKTRTINKRAVMIWVPDVCPACSNLRAVT